MDRFAAHVAALVAAALAFGCGGGSAGLSPVNGTLTVDGKPVAGAVVMFHPAEPGGRVASGTVEPDGSFRLSTDAAGDGAAAGKYKVVVQPAVEGGATPFDDPGKPSAPVRAVGPRVPERFTRLDQTPLTQDLPAPGPVVLDLPGR